MENHYEKIYVVNLNIYARVKVHL